MRKFDGKKVLVGLTRAERRAAERLAARWKCSLAAVFRRLLNAYTVRGKE